MKTSLFVAACCVIIFLSLSANAALVSRLDGQAVYDTDLNITWLADANLAVSEPFGFGVVIGQLGSINWHNANRWIAGMNTANYLGFNDWRLPTALNQDGSGPTSGFNCTNSEMCHLFYNDLGGTQNTSISLSTDPDIAMFSNIQPRKYWAAESATISSAWSFNFGSGVQDGADKGTNMFVWAVRSGDVSAVPVPAAIWFFGSGLIGLIGIARRKTAA